MKKTKWVIGSVIVALGLTSATLVKDDYFEITKNIEIFINVFKELNYNYVDDLDPNELMRVGVDAMVGSLDPFTNYITENQVERYRLNEDGKYLGLGANLDVVDNFLTVLEVYENSPATEAGLRAGDRILVFDGLDMSGRSMDEVNQVIRGVPGSEVELQVTNKDGKDRRAITLNRGDVRIPNVPYSGIVKDHVGYIKLTTFTAGAGENIRKALKSLKEEDPQLTGVILDLRYNGGGLLAEAVDICNIFIPKGELVVTNRGKVIERDQPFLTRKEAVDTEIPVVVMINKRSASASEIVSGVLQDYDRGVLMGQRSYGKGLVQNTKEVGYNNRVKLTTSKYYIPSQRCIQSVEYKNGEPVDIPEERRSKFKTRNGRTVLDGGGITPDIKLEANEESELIKALQEQHIIFKYVNEYVEDIDSIAASGTFVFNDFEGFTDFVKKEKFTYQTEAEKTIIDLKEKSKNLAPELDVLLSKIAAEKTQAFAKDREQIINEIEQQIVGRFYFEGGKAHQALNRDDEILQAVDLINDPKRYQSILK